MADDEELNVAKLNELNPALDDLKIVDVRRKPAGLSADLKVPGDFAKQDDAAVLGLAEKGFFVAPLEPNGPVELFSNDGEFRIMMKDGVEYVLRFGDIAGSAATKKEGAKKTGGLNRYLLVMAQFDPQSDRQADARTASQDRSQDRQTAREQGCEKQGRR